MCGCFVVVAARQPSQPNQLRVPTRVSTHHYSPHVHKSASVLGKPNTSSAGADDLSMQIRAVVLIYVINATMYAPYVVSTCWPVHGGTAVETTRAHT